MQKPDSPMPIAMFFPEVTGFVLLVVLSPAYALQLMHQHHYPQAIVLAASTLMAGAAFVWFLGKRRRWSAWLTMAGLFLIFWMLTLSLPDAAVNLLKD